MDLQVCSFVFEAGETLKLARHHWQFSWKFFLFLLSLPIINFFLSFFFHFSNCGSLRRCVTSFTSHQTAMHAVRPGRHSTPSLRLPTWLRNVNSYSKTPRYVYPCSWPRKSPSFSSKPCLQTLMHITTFCPAVRRGQWIGVYLEVRLFLFEARWQFRTQRTTLIT